MFSIKPLETFDLKIPPRHLLNETQKNDMVPSIDTNDIYEYYRAIYSTNFKLKFKKHLTH